MEPPAPHPALDLVARLNLTLLGLLHVIAAKFRILGPLTGPLWQRISSARQRLARLLTAIAAGHPPRRRPRDPAHPRPTPAQRPDRAPSVQFSRRPAWIVDQLGWEAAAFSSQLTYLLDDPPSRAALMDAAAQSPAIGRTLRPLCRLLGVPLPPWLRLPPRPRPPRKPRAPKPRRPRAPALDPSDHPLPAYVRAAARAWKPRKIGPA
jgi:hypothetical protein